MIRLDIPRVRQTPKACGPASLLQVMRFFGFQAELDSVIDNLDMSREEFDREGVSEGTLGRYAIKKGFDVRIISFDTKRFDCTWHLDDKEELVMKLSQQLKFLKDASVEDRIDGYSTHYRLITTEHLLELSREEGSGFEFSPISHTLIETNLKKGIPVIALVSTPLFFNNRRRYRGVKDDIKGNAFGHWIVISGSEGDKYWITDPDDDNDPSGVYTMDRDRLLNCIVQYGPVIMIVTPKEHKTIKNT